MYAIRVRVPPVVYAILTNEAVRASRFTAAGLAMLITGWLWLAGFVAFGFSRHAPVDSGANFGSLICLWFAPLALIASLAGLFFDEDKPSSFLALSVSMISSLLVLGMGG
jgi:hypothetical protein